MNLLGLWVRGEKGEKKGAKGERKAEGRKGTTGKDAIHEQHPKISVASYGGLLGIGSKMVRFVESESESVCGVSAEYFRIMLAAPTIAAAIVIQW